MDYQHFDEVLEGRVRTALDLMQYVCRLSPHFESEHLTGAQFSGLKNSFLGMLDGIQGMDNGQRLIDGLHGMLRGVALSPELIADASRIKPPAQVIGALAEVERYASIAKADFDAKQRVRLAWAPTLTPRYC